MDAKNFHKEILDNLYDGLYFVDRERRITYWNHGAERISGYAGAAVLGSSCADNILVHVDGDGVSLCAAGCPIAQTLLDGETREAQVFMHHARGHRVPVLVRVSPIRDSEGRIVGAVEVFSDNTTLAATLREVEDLHREVFLDPLTGVENRRSLDARLHGCLAEARNLGARAGLLFFDVDDFKCVNDRYGHAAGDAALRTVAETVCQNLRSGDVVGRWGGDEFCAVVRDVGPGQALAIAEKLRVMVENSSPPVGGGALRVTVSLGATLIRPEDTPESVIARADALLYRSKQAGRNRVTFEE